MQFKFLVSLFLASAAIAAPVARPAGTDLSSLGSLGQPVEDFTGSITETFNQASSSTDKSGNGNGNGNAAGNGSGSGNGNGSGSDNSASADSNGQIEESGNGNEAGTGNGNGNEIDGNGANNNGSPEDFLNNLNFGNIGTSGEADCDQDVDQNGLVNLNVSPCIAL